MSKVHILPTVDPSVPDPGNGGIHRVILAQYQALPQFGWEITETPAEADVIHCHVEIPGAYLKLYPDKPFVVTSHGFYWTDGGYEWDQWCYEVNRRELAAIRAADVVTGVSHWVSQAIRRNTLRDVRTVYHGVDMAEWDPVPPEERGSYVLWNKTRADPVCDPRPVYDAASLLPRIQFISTFGSPARNVEIVGKMTHAEGRELVRRAGVYLATTRETWGIGTLEAMAAGVPVVGYAHGGQVEMITHGVDGWLATPGDVEGIAEGIEWALANRERIGAAARETAAQYTLERAAEGYAALYVEAVETAAQRRSGPRVSVIVPAYNMGDYLDDALRSVAAQTLDDWECIVVNDASPDERDEAIAGRWSAADQRFSYVTLSENGYLANARNVGIKAARGRYIMPLDADDQLAPHALATLAAALDQDRGLHIAYGNVRFVHEDGQTPQVWQGHEPGHSGWPFPFRLDWMLNGPGQLLPYASMYRREVWERTGGYRTRCRSSEDQDFWLRATSYGFTAQMVTDADTLIYRMRAASMSAVEGWEEHRGWYPWVANRDLIPAGAVQEDKPTNRLPMPALDPTPVAVIIPVGPGHAPFVYDAVDSVDAQTFRNFECIVVNDSGEPLPPLPSWVHVVNGEGRERLGGAAAARNAGIRASRAPLFLPLDADDYLQPEAVEHMLANYMGGKEPAVIYSDFYEDPEGVMRVYQTPDYDPHLLVRRGAIHAVTALTPRRFWEEVGGYAEDVPWEDWVMALAIAGRGYCSRRVALPLFTYRKHTGMRRNQNVTDFEASKAAIMQLDFGATRGGELLACGRCPSGAGTTSGTWRQTPMRNAAPPEDAVLLRYTGNRAGNIPIRSTVNQQVIYRFSMTKPEGYVHKDDLPKFENMSDFQVVPQAEAVASQAARQHEPLVAARMPVGAGAPALPAMPEQPPAPLMPEAAAMPGQMAPVSDVAPPANEAAPPENEGAPPEQERESRPARPLSPQASDLAAKHSREELNRIAAQEGITNAETLATKSAVAQAIITKRQMFGA